MKDLELIHGNGSGKKKDLDYVTYINEDGDTVKMDVDEVCRYEDHLEVVKFMAHSGVRDWTHGFRNALGFGHHFRNFEIAKFLIDRFLPSLTHVLSFCLKYAYIFRTELIYKREHDEIIKLLIDCGAENLDKVFRRACRNGNIPEIMCYLNFDYEDVMREADRYGNGDMIYMLIMDEDF